MSSPSQGQVFTHEFSTPVPRHGCWGQIPVRTHGRVYLTQHSLTPPRPQDLTHLTAGDEAPEAAGPGAAVTLTGAPRAPTSNGRGTRGSGRAAPQGRSRAGPRTPWQRDAAAHGARRRRGGAAARPALYGATELRGPGPAGLQRGGSPAWHRSPRQLSAVPPPAPLTRAGLGLLQQRGAVLSLLGLHLAITRTTQRAQSQTAVRHR